jgi:hypothetical protein
MLWLSADLRDQWRELRGIRTRLDATEGTAAIPATAAAASAPQPAVSRDHA